MRALTTTIAYIALVFGSAAQGQVQGQVQSEVEAVVDLNQPGMMETLAERNPLHYQKIVRILDEIWTHQTNEVPEWLRVSFDARDVTYTPVLLVSNPPKRDLSFVLGNMRYKARVTLERVTLESVL